MGKYGSDRIGWEMVGEMWDLLGHKGMLEGNVEFP